MAFALDATCTAFGRTDRTTERVMAPRQAINCPGSLAQVSNPYCRFLIKKMLGRDALFWLYSQEVYQNPQVQVARTRLSIARSAIAQGCELDPRKLPHVREWHACATCDERICLRVKPTRDGRADTYLVLWQRSATVCSGRSGRTLAGSA